MKIWYNLFLYFGTTFFTISSIRILKNSWFLRIGALFSKLLFFLMGIFLIWPIAMYASGGCFICDAQELNFNVHIWLDVVCFIIFVITYINQNIGKNISFFAIMKHCLPSMDIFHIYPTASISICDMIWPLYWSMQAILLFTCQALIWHDLNRLQPLLLVCPF